MDSPRPLILFDGVCNLCNSAVSWIIARDSHARFTFASLQSQAARSALAAAAPATLPDSIVLIDGDGVHTRSDAALRIAGGLGFPWSLAIIFRLVPRALRDLLYAWIARHRYQWFGRRETCMRPTPELQARFLDAGEAVGPARSPREHEAPDSAAPPPPPRATERPPPSIPA